MSRHPAVWSDPATHLRATSPDHPVLYFAPARLRQTARQFVAGFPGLVTYAVKANDAPAVLENLAASGITAFDVASPDEMQKVHAAAPTAVMHYNNPVRSRAELAEAVRFGVASYAVDDRGELDKLIAAVPRAAEVSVRLKLPVEGAAYDFGAKFGADPDAAVTLLQRVAEAGFTPSMTFHPGTQCERAEAWTQYIDMCADVARRAGVTLARLNVGGGFPSHRIGSPPDLNRIFDTIKAATARAFDIPPALVCEPGRAMVAEAFILAARVKSRRDGGVIYLNDGIYGGMAEAAFMGSVDRITVLSPDGARRTGESFSATVFGPTCDSLDRIKGTVALPRTIAEDDYLIIEGMGGYSTATVTRFNGYGAFEIVTIGAE